MLGKNNRDILAFIASFLLSGFCISFFCDTRRNSIAFISRFLIASPALLTHNPYPEASMGYESVDCSQTPAVCVTDEA